MIVGLTYNFSQFGALEQRDDFRWEGLFDGGKVSIEAGAGDSDVDCRGGDDAGRDRCCSW